MLTEGSIDGRQRCQGEKPDESCEDYINGASSISSSPLYNFENDLVTFEYEHSSSRQLLFDQVTKLDSNRCELTTSLRTNYKGWNKASGIMFEIQASKEPIELLTLEFPTWEDYGSSSVARKVHVYYHVGSFLDVDVMSDSSAWTLVADTSARLISPLLPPDAANPDEADRGAIVPTNEFKPVSLEPGQTYSIYIAGQVTSPNPEKTLLKVKPAVGLVRDKSVENQSLRVLTGVRLKGSSFPNTFQEAAEFNGVLHYRATKSCNDSMMFATTNIVLKFAVNQTPNDKLKGDLRNAVYETLSEWLTTNKDLARFVKDYMLKLEGIILDYIDPDGTCPVEFAACTVVETTVLFKHSHNLDQGFLKAEILGPSKILDASVYGYLDPVESAYLGDTLAKTEFVITLTGVPPGAEMNKIQNVYFEEVTANFLRNLSASKVLNAVVNEVIPETLFKEDEQPPESQTRRNLFSLFDFTTPAGKPRVHMRRRRRYLQATGTKGKIQIITEIAAEGSIQELRNTVLGGIGNDSVHYSRELISQQNRPIEMSEIDGAFFTEITNVQVRPYVPTNEGPVPSVGNGTVIPVDKGGGGSSAVIICILLIVLSILWLFYRVYTDFFYSPIQKPIKLGNDNDEFKDEEESVKKSKLMGLLQIPSFHDVNSDKTRDSSSKIVGNDTKNRSKLTKSQKSLSSRSRSRSGSRKRSSSTVDGQDLSCSSADIESSDEESTLASPRRSLGGPKRGRFTPSHSLPIQNRSGVKKSPLIVKSQKTTSPSIPKRGRLTATKSMPVQKRNEVEPKTDLKKQIKGTPKPAGDDKPQKRIPHRSSSGPKRGRLTATRSMPVQKRNWVEPKTDLKKQIKGAPKPAGDDKPQRRTPRRSLSGPKRGTLTATRSMPVQKRNVVEPKTDLKKQMKVVPKRSIPHSSPSGPARSKMAPSKSLPVENRHVRRATSIPIDKKKKYLSKKSTSSSSPLHSKEDNTKGVKSVGSILAMKKKSQGENSNANKHGKKIEKFSSHSKSKKVNKVSSRSESTKIGRPSSHSQANKKKTVEKSRGIKASKSMPVQTKKKKSKSKSEKPSSESSFIRLADMVHGSLSDSDSADSSSLSECTFPSADFSANSGVIPRMSSWTSDSSAKRSPDSRYGKAGKIQYGGAKRGLHDVAE